jgi:pyrroline-5-carboxylate reductase
MVGKRIGFIGAGIMGKTLSGGIIEARLFPPENVFAYDAVAEKIERLARERGVVPAASNRDVLKRSDIVVFAVKPQNVAEVLAEVAPEATSQHLFISIVAGTTMQFIESRLKTGHPDLSPRLVRIMTNTPAQIKAGATALAKGKNASDDDLSLARRIFEVFGVTVTVEEELLDLVTGLSGSGPAYIFLMIEGLIDAGIRLGLKPEDADLLVKQTVLGAAQMARVGPEPPVRLREMVTTPGGTTAAGLKVLRAADFDELVYETVKAATARSKELGSKNSQS